jgi:hypothetical protein
MTFLRKGVSPTFDGQRDTQQKTSTIESTGKKHITLREGKTKAIVKLFASGRRLSCLDHYWTGDTCLHSTVSSLSKRYGLSIPRVWAMLPNRVGVLTRVKQYWFSSEDIARMLPLVSDEAPIISD